MSSLFYYPLFFIQFFKGQNFLLDFYAMISLLSITVGPELPSFDAKTEAD